MGSKRGQNIHIFIYCIKISQYVNNIHYKMHNEHTVVLINNNCQNGTTLAANLSNTLSIQVVKLRMEIRKSTGNSRT